MNPASTPPVQKMTEEYVYENSTWEGDKFTGITYLVSPTLKDDQTEWRGSSQVGFWTARYLMFFKTDDGGSYSLSVYQNRSRPMHFEEIARTDHAEELPAEVSFEIGESDDDLAYDESVAVHPTRELLERGAREGLEIKFYGASDSYIASFSAEFLRGFLAKVDGAPVPVGTIRLLPDGEVSRQP